MIINLKGKTAVVAGGCGLLGKAISTRMGDAGADVIRADISEFADRKLDTTSRESVDSFFESIERLDIWVNATYPAGFGPHAWGFLRGTCEAAKKMTKNGGGVIINLASIYGHCGPKMHLYRNTVVRVPSPGYSFVKAGILGMTRNLAKLYESCNIRVISISPGGVFDNQDENFTERYKRLVPLRRMATPDDIAYAVVFLASDQASYINGCDIPIDGGFLA